MILKELVLKNFRTYNSLTIKFNKPLTFFIGPNGIGKTNILEAAYLLGTTKSFRGVSDRDLITWKESTYFVKGYFEPLDNKNYELSIGFNKNGTKHYLVDKKKIEKAKDFFGKIAFVIFAPDDIQLINGAPKLRRRYLDSILSKVSDTAIGSKSSLSSAPLDYLKILSKYNRVHKIKTLLLKKIRKRQSSVKELEIWDKPFAEYAVSISTIRARFVNSIKEKFSDFFSSISGTGERVLLKLSSGLGKEIAKTESNDMVRLFKQKILDFRSEEIKAGYPLFGAHKDDLLILHKGGRSFSKFASQGQKRALALALRLAEYDFIKTNRKGFPVLLVDDVLAELDIDKKGYFLNELLSAKQALITATDIDYYLKDRLNSTQSNWEVYRITRESLLEKLDTM